MKRLFSVCFHSYSIEIGMGQQGGLGKEENWLGISEMWDERIAFEFQKSSIIYNTYLITDYHSYLALATASKQ